MADDEIRALRAENAMLKTENQNLLDQVQGLGVYAAGSTVAVHDLRTELAWRDSVAHQRTQVASLKSRVDDLQSENARLVQENIELRATVAALQATVDSQSDELATSTAKQVETDAKLAEVLVKMQAMESQANLLTDRAAADALDVKLSREIWAAGRKKPFRLMSLSNMLKFLDCMKSGSTKVDGICGDLAVSAWEKLPAETRGAVFEARDSVMAEVESTGADDIPAALQALKQAARLAAHPTPTPGVWAALEVTATTADHDQQADAEEVLKLRSLLWLQDVK
eukprot:m.476896 g.476896  ORF g.476896 m.476896 type:complete len:283 (-) comp20688_c0_seq1:172-1020(-)